ncbi:MAG: SEC-C domain-containing protein [Acidimicrobiales bacterium]
MAEGRNQRCSCGSGRKAKRCCGVRRGPSEADLARAWLDVEARREARVLLRHDEDDLVDIVEEMVDLPSTDMSLQLPLPRVLPPELESLRAAVASEKVERVADALPPALALVDNPPVRRCLAEAVRARRDAGRLGAAVAAAAVVELANSSTSRLVRNSLIEALAVSTGQAPTPSGLFVAAR